MKMLATQVMMMARLQAKPLRMLSAYFRMKAMFKESMAADEMQQRQKDNLDKIESFQRLAEPRVARLGAAGRVAFNRRRRQRDDVAPGARGRRRVLVGVVEYRREAPDVLGRLPDLRESNSVAPTAWGVTPSGSHSLSGEASKGVHGRGRRAFGRVAVVRRERPAPHEEGRALAAGREAGERRVAACV